MQETMRRERALGLCSAMSLVDTWWSNVSFIKWLMFITLVYRVRWGGGRVVTPTILTNDILSPPRPSSPALAPRPWQCWLCGHCGRGRARRLESPQQQPTDSWLSSPESLDAITLRLQPGVGWTAGLVGCVITQRNSNLAWFSPRVQLAIFLLQLCPVSWVSRLLKCWSVEVLELHKEISDKVLHRSQREMERLERWPESSEDWGVSWLTEELCCVFN